jgi:hypothetical protein
MTLQIEETLCQTHSFEQQSYTFKQPLQFKWVVDLSDVPEFSLIHLVFRTCSFFNPGNCRSFTSAPEECSSDRFLGRNLMRVCATLVGLGQTTEGLFFYILLQR